MIFSACSPLPASERMLDTSLMELAIGGLFFALLTAVLMAPLMRRRYRQKVSRLMGLNQLGVARADVPAQAASPPEPEPAPAPRSGALDAAGLAALAMQRERRIQRASLAAWAAWVALPGLFLLFGRGGSPLSDALGFSALAALVGLGAVQVNWPAGRRWRLPGLGLSSCALAALVCWAAWPANAAEAQETSSSEALLVGLLVGAMYFVSLHRSLRGQVLPLFIIVLSGLCVAGAALVLLQSQLGSCWADLASPQAGTGQQLLGALSNSLLMLLGTWAGFAALALVVRVLERGWLSEVSLISLYTLVVWAAILSAAYATEFSPSPGSGSALLLVWLGGTIASYALALGPEPDAGHGPQLLMLRVFSSDSRRHDLLDLLQGRWRFVGAVHQIGGPDMVAMNVDPYELMKFLANRLHELFLPTGISRADLQARLLTQPDKEGRYRINEVFCFNTAWQATVVQLMQCSAAIVLDLRGMTKHRAGTGFEIKQLAQLGLLHRVVAVGGRDTDWLHVDLLLREAGQQPAALQRLSEDEGSLAADLFARLLSVAAGADRGD
ncbi:hypothetical protein [Paucibacter sp. KCTC 42545]|uniref:hypothetical protein n=1 Tax=Paucibacter sp. KCTC 42545 TaxID=1768242 RepID=UPI000733B486|nr:hypothetical protein [Paucibacter sp. KCTC 42545]ALT76345.1 hypothetical protein AT984_03115 [Paucibacter sp. KCTC 42545]